MSRCQRGPIVGQQRRDGGVAHDGARPAPFTVSAHFAASRLTNAAYAEGVASSASTPRSCRRFFISAVRWMAATSALSLSTTAARHAGRPEQAEPGRDLVARQAALGHRRHLGQQLAAPGAGHRQRLEPAGLHVRQRRRLQIEHQRHVAGQHIGQRRCAALVRHMQQLDAGIAGEQLAGEMVRRAEAGRRVGELARLAPGQRDHVGHGSPPAAQDWRRARRGSTPIGAIAAKSATGS